MADSDPLVITTSREFLDQRLNSLDMERNPWVPVWRDIAEYIMPLAGKRLYGQISSGQGHPGWPLSGIRGPDDQWSGMMNERILDNVAGHAIVTAKSGIMSNLTNQNIRWFALEFPELINKAEEEDKEWLSDMENAIMDVFSWSNLYKVLPSVYMDLLLFGTAALGVFPDSRRGLKFERYPIGTFWIDQDHDRRPNTFFRVQQKTVYQIVQEYCMTGGEIDEQKFGNLSLAAQESWRNGQFDDHYELVEYIGPKLRRKFRGGLDLVHKYEDREGKMVESPWTYIVYERSGDRAKDMKEENILYKSGFRQFPVLIPRWDVTEPDIYGQSPGMTVLPDVKQLQVMTEVQNDALEKQVSPPTQISSNLSGRQIDLRANAVNPVGQMAGQEGIKPIFQFEPRLDYFTRALEKLEKKINTYLFYDLFLALNNIDRSNVTATQVIEMRNERMSQLNPLLYSMEDDFLKPLVDIAFERVSEMGLVPSREGIGDNQGISRVNAKYISQMAMALKSQTREQTTLLVNLADEMSLIQKDLGDIQVASDLLDKDKVFRLYASQLGADPDITLSDKEVQMKRDIRMQMLAQSREAPDGQ